jgi:hypothetical protein
MLVQMWGKGSPYILLVGMQTSVLTMEISMEVHQKSENRCTV